MFYGRDIKIPAPFSMLEIFTPGALKSSWNAIRRLPKKISSNTELNDKNKKNEEDDAKKKAKAEKLETGGQENSTESRDGETTEQSEDDSKEKAPIIGMTYPKLIKYLIRRYIHVKAETLLKEKATIDEVTSLRETVAHLKDKYNGLSNRLTGVKKVTRRPSRQLPTQ